jgi:hypothetical protein
MIEYEYDGATSSITIPENLQRMTRDKEMTLAAHLKHNNIAN